MHWIRENSPPQRAGDGAGERRLADAGPVLDQQVPLGKQGDQQVGEHGVVHLDRTLHVGNDARAELLDYAGVERCRTLQGDPWYG